MKQEDIIRMAREAGFNVEKGFLLRVTGIDEDLERFAALVRADDRYLIERTYYIHEDGSLRQRLMDNLLADVARDVLERNT